MNLDRALGMTHKQYIDALESQSTQQTRDLKSLAQERFFARPSELIVDQALLLQQLQINHADLFQECQSIQAQFASLSTDLQTSTTQLLILQRKQKNQLIAAAISFAFVILALVFGLVFSLAAQF